MNKIKLTTVTMQLIESVPDGIRICRVTGESLVTLVIPRNLVAEAKRLPDLPSRGIYFLLDENHGTLSRVYAGQTTQGLNRLDAHKARKDFWNLAVMFLDTEYNINRDVLDALECSAIKYVQYHGSYETDNTVIPSLIPSPYIAQTVEHLLENILFRMKVLGFDLNRAEEGPEGSDELFHTRKNGVIASGRYDKTNGHFLVLSGSQVALNNPIIKNKSAINARENVFGHDADGLRTLDRDLEFQSPSAAAVFVLGGSQNGWVEWVNERDETLDSVYRRLGTA